MASSLALQLQGNDNFTSKFKASFLFDSRQAADYDLETIFSLGQLNSHFAQFEKTLFSEAIKNVDRNEKLDAMLEWLIRRFRINEFNIDAIMTCILPYHETKPFWTFIRPIRKTAQPLERTQLVAQYFKIAFKSLIIETLPTISDSFLLNIMPFIFDGIRAKNSPDQISARAHYSDARGVLLCEELHIAKIAELNELLADFLYPFLLNLIKHILNSVLKQENLCESILDLFLESKLSSGNSEDFCAKMRELLQILQINKLRVKTQQLLYEFIAQTFKGTRHEPIQESNTTFIRLIALQKLNSAFEDILEQTLLARLGDDVDQISAFKLVSGEKLLDISRKTKIASLDFLTGAFLEANPSLENLVIPIILSNCVATKRTWKTIPKSKLASSPLFARFSTFDRKTLEEIEACEDKEKKLLGLVDLDIQLVKLVADNLELFIKAFSSQRSMWELAIYLIISTILPHILEKLNELRNTQQLSAKDFIASSEGLPSEAHINDIARKGTKFNKIHNVLFSLVNIVSCLKVKEMGSIPWLAPVDSEILVKLYITFTSGQSIGCFEKMVRDDPIEFLSSFWTEDEAESSLHIANAYFLAHADPSTPAYTDFQLVIPSFKVVRHAGLSCLSSIDKAYEKLMGKSIYKYDSFYGSSSDQLQYLLVENIFDKEEFLADPQYIEKFLESKKQASMKESILAFLLSHVISFRKPVAQIKLLRILSQVNSPNKSVVAAEDTIKSDDHILQLMQLCIRCFTPATASLLDSKSSKYLKIGEMTLAQITPELFANLSATKNLASEASTTVVKLVKEVLKSISFDASLVSQEFAYLHQDQPKRARENDAEKQPILLLEYKPSIDKEISLISPLFEMLSVVLNLELGDTPVSVDYINQLILSSLTRLVQNILRVDLVVQCIRSLLLMAAIAALYPDRVLHNIMPVFTFMGANVLRQDDNYSFHKILPPLVASHRQASESNQKLLLAVKPIMSVFHRRLRLFTVLVSTLGEGEFLYAILSLLLEKYTEKVLKGNSAEADSLMEFCLIVSNQFSPQTQMNSLASLMKALLVLPNEKSTDEENVDDTLFDIEQHSNKHLRQFKFASLSFAGKLLSNKAFLSKILTLQDDNQLEQYFLSISELLLSIVTNVTTFVGQKTGDSVEKFWKGLLKVTYDVLDKVNNLLPLPSFLNIVSQLLNHEHSTIRRKSMLLLSEKVANYSECTDAEEAAFVEMVPRLAAVVESAGQSTEQDAVIKQTALLTISALLRRFAQKNPNPFVEILPVVIGDSGLSHSNMQVSASSLVCLTYFCQELGPRVIPQFPKFMPVILNILESCFGEKELSANTRLLVQLSAFSSLETIVKTLPQFLSPYVQRMLACALQPSLSHFEEDDKERKVFGKAQSLLSEMAAKVPTRILLPQVYQYQGLAVKNGTNSLIPLYTVLETAISSMNRANISTHYKSIFKFFLISFDFRRQHGSEFTAEEVDRVESKVIESFLQLVMKLNETLFKPLFLKTLDWATTELAQKDDNSRLIFFYKLLDTLLEKLKSIISPYYVYVLDHTIAKLEAYKSEQKSTDSLWVFMIDSLHKCFLYDNDNFWSGDVFNKVLQPLVDQMDNVNGGAALYHQHIDQHLALWKPLNHEVLLKSRNDQMEIRLASLLTLQDFYSRLGEEFLVLLPETIPFLAELMEDDEQKVEKLTQEVIAQIEQYLGESLQKYFH
ncbi:hypothetical protein K493DRAFT_312976 [Basidiobolus meristosporus CBS 931.73]|uniref:U3 small nucleolar RNA-associated protein 10 n=1 Tax=Basidiobolus meristosporus CBS 931.73 TaxID=1314790 RepID=A0A1Y1YPW8_9FUNG|nr:hypothetical protein K493DRAFT_312976 [Basidiobolus meristosporus CBS 931.73]|eukprot:ORY00070.1 hypothetical protein K493DRAFT_312976 [Basidiobolus meristosporus CBS 931.73]